MTEPRYTMEDYDKAETRFIRAERAYIMDATMTKEEFDKITSETMHIQLHAWKD